MRVFNSFVLLCICWYAMTPSVVWLTAQLRLQPLTCGRRVWSRCVIRSFKQIWLIDSRVTQRFVIVKSQRRRRRRRRDGVHEAQREVQAEVWRCAAVGESRQQESATPRRWRARWTAAGQRDQVRSVQSHFTRTHASYEQVQAGRLYLMLCAAGLNCWVEFPD